MKTIAGTVAIVPSKSSVDKTVKLIAVQILIAGFLIEAQFDSPSYTIVAADFGTSITASERQATEIELLRGEERTRRNLPRRGKFHGPCIRQGLVPREPEIQHGESRRRAIMEGTQEYLAEKFIDAQSKRRPGRYRPRQMARNFGAGIRKVRHHLRSRTDRKYRLPSVAMTSKEP